MGRPFPIFSTFGTLSGCQPLPPVARIAWHQNNCIQKLAMPIRRGTAVIVVGIAAILLLALIFVVPVLINVDRYRPQVISYLQEKTGKQVEIGRLALTFFPLTIHIDHIGVKNPPIFPSGYVAQVARIDAELSVGACTGRWSSSPWYLRIRSGI